MHIFVHPNFELSWTTLEKKYIYIDKYFYENLKDVKKWET